MHIIEEEYLMSVKNKKRYYKEWTVVSQNG